MKELESLEVIQICVGLRKYIAELQERGCEDQAKETEALRVRILFSRVYIVPF